ncbi:MAG: hypothetical protein CFE21_14005 [Bacteroidetes bacterium B1(2017)]|nr:MAG: hypothetical protein CFE21_14005 [Bacteroidetes bacterium B1(2017)]
MGTITNEMDLQAAIIVLELKQDQEWGLVKVELSAAVDSLMPLSLLKNSLKNVQLIPSIKEKLVASAIGLLAGYVSRKAIFSEHSPIKKVLAALVQTGVSIEVSQETELAKMIISGVESMFHKSTSPKRHWPKNEENY